MLNRGRRDGATLTSSAAALPAPKAHHQIGTGVVPALHSQCHF